MENKTVDVLAFCNALEECIADLGTETTSQRWEWSYMGPDTDEEHAENHLESLKMTRDHFKTEGPQKMHSIHVGDLIVALTGTSPYSEARARYLAHLDPSNITRLIAEIRSLKGATNAE